MDENVPPSQELLEVAEASDRAGALVAEHVRAIVQAAELDAERIRAAAEEDARRIVQRAVDAANRVLGQIDALDGPLSEMVTRLRREADHVASDEGSGAS